MPISFSCDGESSGAAAPVDESITTVAPEREDSMGGTTAAMSLGKKMLKKQRFSTDSELHPQESFIKANRTPSMRTMRRKSRATVAQARFAARMAQKMSDRRADIVTIAKDQRLMAVAVGGIALMVADSLLLLQAPEHYSWVGPCLRAVLSFNCVVLVALLWDYYNLLFTRASGDYPPSQQHFWLVTHLRRRFLVEASLAIIHAPPTAFPVEVPPEAPLRLNPRSPHLSPHPSPLTASPHPPSHQVPRPGECRMSGYGQDSPPALSPHCHVVWLSFFALLMFARLYLVMRVLRDSTTLWRYRSVIKAAAVSRFVHFPDIGVRMATMWHVHHHPTRVILAFYATSARPCLSTTPPP